MSVIVPVYNAAHYLHQCLASLDAQTLKNIEIILVNDGSTDDSATLCDEFAQNNPHTTVIHQGNKGQTAARIAGLLRSKGNYIHFVDSDDWLDSTMEEAMYQAAVANDADIVTCDTVFHKGHKEMVARQAFDAGVYTKEQIVSTIYPRMIYGGKRFFYFGIYAAMWNKLFRRDIVLPNIISIDPAIQVGEDGLTTYASFLDASTVVVLKDTLYHYRDDNATSLTRSYRYEQFDSALLLIASLRRIASQHQDTYDLNPQIDIYLLYNIWSIMLEEFYYKTKRPYRHRYQYLNRIVTHPTVQKACDSVLQQDVLGSEQTKFFRLFAPGRFHTLLGATVRNSIDRRINHYTRSTIYGSKPLMASARLISKAKNLAQPSHARVR